MTNLILNVIVYPTTHIKDAAKSAAKLAKLLNTTITFEFNGVKCSIDPDGNPNDVVTKFDMSRYVQGLMDKIHVEKRT